MDFFAAMENAGNLVHTENGALTYDSTQSKLLDLFALGGAYRSRSDEDCVQLFKEAFEEDWFNAIRCLFYLRDCRGGQGERRFFRTCYKWLACNHTGIAMKYLRHIAFYGRYDDYFELFDTPVEDAMIELIKEQLTIDVLSSRPSVLAKWMPSENASSAKTKHKARKLRNAFGYNSKTYRKILSSMRQRIRVLERTMSSGQWDDIEFDKVPSVAGLRYAAAFRRHCEERYTEFMSSKDSKVNASVLTPYDCVHYVMNNSYDYDHTVAQKYWDNLTDYIQGAAFDGIAVVDTSGSMWGTPIEVAISLGLYCAEKCSGPYKDKFITFSSKPQLVKITGNNIGEKIVNMECASWGMNTNVEAVFDLILRTAIANKCNQSDIPQNVIIISDMEFDSCSTTKSNGLESLFESMEKKYQQYGYTMPKLVFWNVHAIHDNIPTINGKAKFVSGFSPSIFNSVIADKSAYEVMMDVLNSQRYTFITKE